MRIMGGWIALTPELPAKLVLGRHVWECAQHADAWGRRLPELRAPAQQSEPPNAAVVEFFDLLESVEGPRQSVERLTGVYRVLKPHLASVYAAHLDRANPVYEPPTRRILERCLGEERRHVAAGAVVLARLASLQTSEHRARTWAERLGQALRHAAGVTGDEANPTFEPARSDVDVGRDLVALDSIFEVTVVPADLAAAVAAHYRGGEILALASLGEYRLVKVRIPSDGGFAVVQSRWRHADGGWEVMTADIVRTDPA
jgi:hypothetical protein